jgi:hypothetical protein
VDDAKADSGELYPMRWIVKSASGRLSVEERIGRPVVPSGAYFRMMGTHETLDHAAKRVGWAT